jgi:peptide/nickel transport system substrate-binding protein
MKLRNLAGLMLLLALVACERRPETASTQASVHASEQPREGGTLIRRLESDFSSLNPVRQATAYDRALALYLHEPLISLDQQSELGPGLATRWEVSPDGRTFTFHLDPRARYSDGQPVRAGDVIFTLRKIVDPATEAIQFSGLFEGLDLEQSAALDERTVRVVFDRARPSQLQAFNIPIIPEHAYSAGDFTHDYDQRVVGAGPYVVADIRRGEMVRLVRRPDPWKEKPPIPEIIFRVINDSTVAWNALQRGEIDESKLTGDQWKTLHSDPSAASRIEGREVYMLGYNFIAWNHRDPQLSDAAVRRALAMALDRENLRGSVYSGSARLMTGPYNESQWAWNPRVPPIRFDLEAAGSLLDSAGWQLDARGMRQRQGRRFDLELMITAGSVNAASEAQVYQSALKKLGIDARITTVEPAVLFQRVFAGKYQAAFLGWDLDLDPDLYSLLHSSQFPPSGQNFFFYSNPRMDQLLVAAREEPDFSRRQALYHEIHALFAAEQPFLPTFQTSTKWGLNRRVKNVDEAPGLGLFSWSPGARQWWLAEPQQAARQ